MIVKTQCDDGIRAKRVIHICVVKIQYRDGDYAQHIIHVCGCEWHMVMVIVQSVRLMFVVVNIQHDDGDREKRAIHDVN